MQIVIELDERYYNVAKKIKKAYDHGAITDGEGVLIDAIANGTPLPDNHGRLIDADELLVEERPRDLSWTQWEDMPFYEVISNAPTVIESTKGE